MNIDEAYKILKLDNRASKREVELAYDTLSKDGVNSGLYRSAFEYIMGELYTEYETNEEKEKEAEEEIYSEMITYMPEEITNAISDLDLESVGEMTNKAIAIWATQNVNLPLLFNGIDKAKTVFGYIKKEDLLNIIRDSACLNNIKYSELTFELSYSSTQMNYKINDLRKFVYGLNDIFEKNLIKKFSTVETELGILCRCIAEKNIADAIVNLIKVKVSHCGCNLNLNICTMA